MRSDMINEKGMTLVEILAALVILGIVFIGFMTIFPQMTKFNEKTESKLETMNLAKRELVELKDSSTDRNDEFKAYINSNKGKNENKVISYNYEVNGYQIKVNFYEIEDLKKNSHPDSKQLHKIHILVMKNGKKNSETFGYLEH